MVTISQITICVESTLFQYKWDIWHPIQTLKIHFSEISHQCERLDATYPRCRCCFFCPTNLPLVNMLLSLLSVCLVARQQLQQLKRRRRRRGEYGFIRILQAIAFMSEIKKRRVNVKKLELALATTTAVTKTMVKIAAVAVMTKSHGAMEGSVHHGTKGGWRRVQHLQGTQTPHLLTHPPPPKKQWKNYVIIAVVNSNEENRKWQIQLRWREDVWSVILQHPCRSSFPLLCWRQCNYVGVFKVGARRKGEKMEDLPTHLRDIGLH